MKKKLVLAFLDIRVMLMIFLFIFSLFRIHPFLSKPNFVRVVYLDDKYFGNLAIDYKSLFLKEIIINGSISVNIKDRESFIYACNKYLKNNSIVKFIFLREVFPYFYEEVESGSIVINCSKLVEIIGIEDIPFSYITLGVDLTGGTRIILKPFEKISDRKLEEVIKTLKDRFDVFGLKSSRLFYIKSGDNVFIVVDVPGGSFYRIKNIISSQGKLEAKIKNDTVFTWKDIVFICTGDPHCEYVYQEGNYWVAEFEIEINKVAAKRLREIIDKYLSKGDYDLYLDIYIDGKKVTSLKIDEGILHERDIDKLTKAKITTKESSRDSVITRKKELQSIISTKPLPTRLIIESYEIVPPKVGKKIFREMLVSFLLGLIIVQSIIAIRYKNPKILILMFFTSLAEVVITLGLYSLGGWTLDLAGLIAIIAMVGMGVDDQITILEESLSRRKGLKEELSVGIKEALFIILVTYVILLGIYVVLVMSPELFLRSFAYTSIITSSIGFFITRYSFSRFIEAIFE